MYIHTYVEKIRRHGIRYGSDGREEHHPFFFTPADLKRIKPKSARKKTISRWPCGGINIKRNSGRGARRGRAL
jgi:hypothetical protein